MMGVSPRGFQQIGVLLGNIGGLCFSWAGGDSGDVMVFQLPRESSKDQSKD